MSSSTTTALSRQPLVQVLRSITDPRDRRGVRHDLPTVLSLAVTGVLAGCRSLTAIWEHTTDLTAADLEALGLEAGQDLPSESTIRRVLQDLDPADVDAHLRSWLCTRAGTINARRVIAVDGKTMRGARTSKDPAPHLLAALDHATGAVLTQQRVAGKSNEIPALRELLKPLDLDGVVVSADAMHTQTGTAQWITRRGGHYLLTPLGNQKTLHRTLKALPWKNVPSTSSVDTGHGRRVRRTRTTTNRKTLKQFRPRGGLPAGAGEDRLDEGIDQPVVGLRGVPPHAVADAVEQHQTHERIGHLRGVRSHVAAAGCQVERRRPQPVDGADEVGLAEIGALTDITAVDPPLARGPALDLGFAP